MTHSAMGCVAPLLKSEAKVVKCDAVDKETLAAGAEHSYDLWCKVQDLPELQFLLSSLFFGRLERGHVAQRPNKLDVAG